MRCSISPASVYHGSAHPQPRRRRKLSHARNCLQLARALTSSGQREKKTKFGRTLMVATTAWCGVRDEFVQQIGALRQR